MANVINFNSLTRSDGRGRIDDLLQEAQQKLFAAGFFEELAWDQMEPELIIGAAEALARAKRLTEDETEWQSVVEARVSRITGLERSSCDELLQLRNDWERLSHDERRTIAKEIASRNELGGPSPA
ncbi:hypothetical protein E5163_07275 [Marinicauda algicola]|uniref:Uncharacterized protein n=1 Tax=Marinicauda algicola TaxID=2029849 RepID=A0A4V6RF48_9PROT|nr:hypothetical protein [Marinicauda algicola]TGY88929.1 hypothetical protein E5163_07275 [Marinicauda algicola]